MGRAWDWIFRPAGRRSKEARDEVHVGAGESIHLLNRKADLS